MMKKYILITTILCLICACTTACSNKEPTQANVDDTKIQDSSTTGGDVDDNNTKPQGESTAGEDSEATVVVDEENTKPQVESTASDGIDVDLTALGSIMVYAEVYNMMTNPDDYMGKTIKMSGPYYASYYDMTDSYYHYVIIEDATACCKQGLEFVWSGDRSYPEDYPEESTQIEVTGVFGSYDELDITYYYLAVDDISILK